MNGSYLGCEFDQNEIEDELNQLVQILIQKIMRN